MSEGVFSDSHVPTVGSQFIALPIEIAGRKIILELWDTAGQEVYRSLVGFYTRETKGAFILCDVTNIETFTGLPEWIKFVTEQSPNVKVIIFANKCDLEEERVVPTGRVQEFARTQNVEVIEGSAKLGQNTTDAFEKMGELMLSGSANPTAAVEVRVVAPKSKGCC
jgi:small GTP-binding protein